MLNCFCQYYSHRQLLSLDKGMIPTKNCLVIKQDIPNKPVRWDFKSFLLCWAKTGYILDAANYTTNGLFWVPQEALSAVLWRILQVTNKNVILFSWEEPAGSTGSRQHHAKPHAYSKERGHNELRCHGDMCAREICGPSPARAACPSTSSATIMTKDKVTTLHRGCQNSCFIYLFYILI